ncbi:unnamed protein product [Rhodiola kirilowii]
MERNLAFYMIFFSSIFTVFMLFISFHTTHIFIASHNELKFKVPKESFVLQNLKRLKLSLYKEPAPSQSPAPSPAPALVLAKSHPPVPPPLRVKPFVPRGSSGQKDGGEGRRRMVVVVVFVSVGSVTLLILAGFVLVCFLRKLRRHGKSWPLTVKGRFKHRSMHASPQTSVGSNVGLNPKLDLFHFQALNADLEHDPFADSVSANKISNQKQTPSKSETGHQVREDENVSCSVASTREILSVHGSADSIVGYESDDGDSNSICGDDKHISNDHCNSSDDESFHSVYGSHSSSIRLSNASVSTLSEQPVTNSSPLRDGLIPPPPPPPPPLPHPKSSFTPSVTKLRSNKIVKVNICNDPSEPTPSRPPPSPPLPPSSKAPPPPLPLLSNFIPMGENGSPLPKLKPLHWDKVRAESDKSMVWDKLKSSSFRLDEEMIESLFGYNVKNSGTDDKSKSKSPSPSKHVLEPKRLQNITILSKALNITAEQVCHALLLGNGLSLQQLEALVKMVPTIEESQKLATYNGNINELGSAEQFVKMIISVPFAFPRIEAMLYRETFEDEVVHLKKSLSVLEDACIELRSSRLFLKLLEAVLQTGNRMNVGTIRGGAQAFKLDALLKLSDVKGTDGKTTLLHFVVQEMVRSEGQKEAKTIVGRMNQRKRSIKERVEHYKTMGLELISSLSNELSNVKKTASIDLEVLASSVLNLTHGMAELRKLVEHDLAGEQGGFVERMRSFFEYGEKSLKELEEEERSVLRHVKEITEYFHGALSKEEGNHVRIFVIVRDFLGMLDVVCKELKSLKTSNAPNPLAPFRLN